MKSRNVSLIRIIAVFLIITSMVLTLACCGKKNENKDTITISVKITNPDGKTETVKIDTKADNLADALLEKKLVEGEETDYGLYITTVKGVKAEDGYWWALTDKDGEMLQTGASSTPIADGDIFGLEYSAY